MNIRDIIFINKAKSTDRIKILEMLGFETETVITQNTEVVSDLQNDDESLELNSYTDIQTEIKVESQQSSIESYIKDTEYRYTEKVTEESENKNFATETFKPVNVTSKVKKIWTDVESRRKWVMPLMISVISFFIITTAVTTFISRSSQQEEVVKISSNLATETNVLINGLENVLAISTDTFYSKYDISNASAYLQSVESSVLEYQNLAIQNENLNLQDVSNNLSTIFSLINELDNLLTYRILISEILIYDDILDIDETTQVDVLTTSLSEITATSKRNYAELPIIEEMNNHRNLVNTAIITAEDLHGRLLAALRNAEYDVVKSISNALLLNKETEIAAFENSLNIFKNNKLIFYSNIEKLD